MLVGERTRRDGVCAVVAEAIRSQAGFASVMATGVVSVAGAELGRPWLSWLFGGAALSLYCLLVLSEVERGWRVAPAEAFARVAATAVLGTRLALAGWRIPAFVLLAAAALLWLSVWPSLYSRRGVGSPTGTRLLAVVATQSLAILATTAGSALAPAAVALFALGLLLYPLLLVRFRAGELRRGAGDIWITMGALAISALAAARLDAQVGGHPLWILTLALWLAASCWIPLLVLAEMRWPRLRVEPQRWSTVFPIGMYSASSAAVGHALGVHAFTLAHVVLWAAVIVWLLTAAGTGRSIVHHRPAAKRT